MKKNKGRQRSIILLKIVCKKRDILPLLSCRKTFILSTPLINVAPGYTANKDVIEFYAKNRAPTVCFKILQFVDDN
jgi:hypothetical protein